MSKAAVVSIALVSPSDVKAERSVVEKIVNEMRYSAQKLNVSLDLRRWEEMSGDYSPTGPQGLILKNLRIEDCTLVIGTFWKRFGTVDEGGQSRTALEIQKAIDARQSTGKDTPIVKILFSKVHIDPDDFAEVSRVRDYRDKVMSDNQLLFEDYSDLEDYAVRVRRAIEDGIRSVQSGQSADLTCKATVQPALFRAEGYTEPAQDINLALERVSGDDTPIKASIKLYASTNITSRTSGLYRYPDMAKLVMSSQHGGDTPIGQANLIIFEDLTLFPNGETSETLIIRGLRLDAELLGAAGLPVHAEVEITLMHPGAEDTVLQQQVLLGLTVDSLFFRVDIPYCYEPTDDNATHYAKVPYFDRDDPTSKAVVARFDRAYAPRTSEIPQFPIVQIPFDDIPHMLVINWNLFSHKSSRIFVTLYDLDLLGPKGQMKAVARSTSGYGEPTGTRPIIPGMLWKGVIPMVEIPRAEPMVWEITPAGLSSKHLEFGIVVKMPHPDQINNLQLGGGYGPFFDRGSVPRSPSDLPTPRFVPGLDPIDIDLNSI